MFPLYNTQTRWKLNLRLVCIQFGLIVSFLKLPIRQSNVFQLKDIVMWVKEHSLFSSEYLSCLMKCHKSFLLFAFSLFHNIILFSFLSFIQFLVVSFFSFFTISCCLFFLFFTNSHCSCFLF